MIWFGIVCREWQMFICMFVFSIFMKLPLYKTRFYSPDWVQCCFFTIICFFCVNAFPMISEIITIQIELKTEYISSISRQVEGHVRLYMHLSALFYSQGRLCDQSQCTTLAKKRNPVNVRK